MFELIATEIILQVLSLLSREDLDRIFQVNPMLRSIIGRHSKILPQTPLHMTVKHPGRLGTTYRFMDESGTVLKEVDGLTAYPESPLRTRWLLTPYFFGRYVRILHFYTSHEISNQSFLDLARQLMPLRRHWQGATVSLCDLPNEPRKQKKLASSLYAFLGLFRNCPITTDFFEQKVFTFKQIHTGMGLTMSNLCSIDVYRLDIDPQTVIDWLFSPCLPGGPAERTLVIELGAHSLYLFLLQLDRAFRNLDRRLEHSFTVVFNTHFTLKPWNLLPHQKARLYALENYPSVKAHRTARYRFKTGSMFGQSLYYACTPPLP
ncbi:hypothetical protein AAVH_22474 [Aphelenchoides avenae]|nr:hypothetical protein AAVH_22474 [Aphelenchus avenae]